MSFSCSACITAHFIQPLDILPRPVTKPDLQMLKQPLNLCGIFGVKKGQSGDECAICTREPAIAVCLNNARRPQTKTDLCLPRVALWSLRSGCPHRASRTCFSFRSLWACRACRTGISLWTLWTCISRQTGLSPLSPCHLSAPAGLQDQHHLPVPVRRLPRQGRCHRALPYHPSAPEDPRAPVPPLARCLLYTNPHPGICDVCQSALGGLFPSGSFLPPRQRFFELFLTR
ncbi:hypothetical protein ECDEC1A_1402 [Escherichia coli DEC1A]|nr:hypothetical protein ECDEC1A_1402 [Escherichia coli DEC1A]